MIIELTFSTIMMLALIGLSIDGTRWILLQMETRFLSMTAAQAGAVALDGQSPHALTDAYQRANDMIAVNTTLLDSVTTITAQNAQACKNISGGQCAATTDPATAQYLQVSLATVTQPIFLPLPFALTAAATATAPAPPQDNTKASCVNGKPFCPIK